MFWTITRDGQPDTEVVADSATEALQAAGIVAWDDEQEGPDGSLTVYADNNTWQMRWLARADPA
jgi:hypothetical protein